MVLQACNLSTQEFKAIISYIQMQGQPGLHLTLSQITKQDTTILRTICSSSSYSKQSLCKIPIYHDNLDCCVLNSLSTFCSHHFQVFHYLNIEKWSRACFLLSFHFIFTRQRKS